MKMEGTFFRIISVGLELPKYTLHMQPPVRDWSSGYADGEDELGLGVTNYGSFYFVLKTLVQLGIDVSLSAGSDLVGKLGGE